MDISQFTISVDEEALQDLKRRLSTTKYPDQLEEADLWKAGSPVSDVRRLAKYWHEGFDWRKAEAELNRLPQFTTPIDVDGFGIIDLHFVHQPSPEKNAIPLLFSHGWPGSFIEVKKLLPLLQGADDQPAFHIVAPSLPNFGFSSGVTKPGFGLIQYAETSHKLMLKLGYNQYVTQGGDWGFAITRTIGLQYPSHCKASHLNMILATAPTWKTNPLLALKHAFTPYTSRERSGLQRTQWFDTHSFGYNILQSSKPQTISFALSDSPVALLSWIYEKLHDWTDDYPWTDDEVLTWISIYWFSRAGPAASVRIYYEAQNAENIDFAMKLRRWIPHVKIGVAHFPGEISVLPRIWAETLGDVVLQSEHDKGGHFAATERPEAIAADLNRMFGRGGKCYGIVDGCSGYHD